MLFFSGEPGAGIPSTKSQIEAAFGGACIDMGSMAEMTPWMTNAECDERRGMHCWDDIVYTEILDPQTEEPVGPGEVGVPVYTHLERDSQPMIRLWSGDLSRWTDEPCPCGRTYRRLPDGLFGRADDMLVIRGENVYPAAIEEAVRAGGCDGEFRVEVVRTGALDELHIHLVPVLLGQGHRLFEDMPPEHIELEPTRAFDGPGVQHLRLEPDAVLPLVALGANVLLAVDELQLVHDLLGSSLARRE